MKLSFSSLPRSQTVQLDVRVCCSIVGHCSEEQKIIKKTKYADVKKKQTIYSSITTPSWHKHAVLVSSWDRMWGVILKWCLLSQKCQSVLELACQVFSLNEVRVWRNTTSCHCQMKGSNVKLYVDLLVHDVEKGTSLTTDRICYQLVCPHVFREHSQTREMLVLVFTYILF